MKYYIVFILIFIMPVFHTAEQIMDLSIEDAVNMAVLNNDLLKAEYYRQKEAETFRNEAFSYFLPSIDMVGMKLLSEKARLVEFPSFIPGEPPEQVELSFMRNYQISLRFSQILFAGGKVYYNWQIAKLNHEINSYKYREQKEELIFQVKSSYYLCFILQEILNVVKEGIALSREHFKKVDLFYNTGTATYQEWLRAKVQLSNLGPELHQAESNYTNALNNLRLLLGLEDQRINLITELAPDDISELDESMYRSNIKSNLGMKQLEKAMDIADYQKKITLSDYLPNISIGMDYNLGADRFKFSGDYWDDDYTISLNIQLNIFDGFARSARRKRAQYNQRSLDHQAIFYEKSLGTGLEQILNEVETSYKKACSYRDNLADAKEAVRVSNLYYEEGLITSFEVNAVNLDYTRAKMNYLNAVFEYYISKFKLEKLIPEIEK